MKGDFSRDSFDPAHNYSRVLQQQGRVQVDADWNEQAAILLHGMRNFVRDVIGPHAGTSADAFDLVAALDDNGQPIPFEFAIAPGRYYVGGLPCENPQALRYTSAYGEPVLTAGVHLAYLDVWERLVRFIEAPDLPDAALGGIETTARAQVVWRVRLMDPAAMKVQPKVPIEQFAKTDEAHQAFLEFLRANRLASPGTGALAASVAGFAATPTGPTGYRGPDNQLYRIEIHRPGPAWSTQGGPAKNAAATFKWSRENGSVVFGIVRADAGDKGTTRVRVQQLGLDRRLDLQTGDWVELVDDRQVLAARVDPNHPGPPPLLQVQDVDRAQMIVTLAGAPATPLDLTMHPLLRRWDHRVAVAAGEADPGEGALVVQAEPTGKSIKLEHGLEIRFTGDPAYYQTGDYWLISARTTGEIALAPGLTPSATPGYVTARGEVHHYAPLEKIVVGATGNLQLTALRRIVQPVWAAL